MSTMIAHCGVLTVNDNVASKCTKVAKSYAQRRWFFNMSDGVQKSSNAAERDMMQGVSCVAACWRNETA